MHGELRPLDELPICLTIHRVAVDFPVGPRLPTVEASRQHTLHHFHPHQSLTPGLTTNRKGHQHRSFHVVGRLLEPFFFFLNHSNIAPFKRMAFPREVSDEFIELGLNTCAGNSFIEENMVNPLNERQGALSVPGAIRRSGRPGAGEEGGCSTYKAITQARKFSLPVNAADRLLFANTLSRTSVTTNRSQSSWRIRAMRNHDDQYYH